VTLADGTSTLVTELAKGETSHRWPTFLPDGRHFLYFVGTGDGSTGEIRAGSLDSKETVAVVASDSKGLYAAGHVMFVRGGNLMALPFDPDTRQSTADALLMVEQVALDDMAYAAFSVSTTNELAYAHGSARRTARLTLFDLAGKSLGPVGDPEVYYNVALSPNERRVAVSLLNRSPGNRDVWLIDLERAGAPSRFTDDPAADFLPIWSPTGTQIAYSSNQGGGPANIYVRAADRSGPAELALKSATPNYVTDWSRDGRFLAYTDMVAATGSDLWVLPRTGDRKPESFLQTRFNEDNAVFSPDGHWIAYESDESGRPEVYVRPFPKAGGLHSVSRSGGTQPMWRDDGRELFFLTLDGTLMSATISTAKGLEAGLPRTLFPTGNIYNGTNSMRHQYAVTKDGKQLLTISPEQRGSSSTITVSINWLAARQKQP
jgi:hypothetical protein